MYLQKYFKILAYVYFQQEMEYPSGFQILPGGVKLWKRRRKLQILVQPRRPGETPGPGPGCSKELLPPELGGPK